MTRVLAGHTSTFQGHDLDAALQGIAEAGFSHVELSALDDGAAHVHVGMSPAHVRSRLATHGLSATAVTARLQATAAGGPAQGAAALRWCADLGVPVLTAVLDGSHALDDAIDPRVLDALLRAADETAVDLALEIHGDLLGSGARAVTLFARVAHARLKACYDTANCEYHGGVAASRDLETMLPYLGGVHLQDKRGGVGEWDFPPLGDGHVDFRAVLGVLDRGGYAGPLTVEIRFTGAPWPSHAAATAALRRSRRHLHTLGVT